MEKCDNDSYVINLDNEYIKNRKVDYLDENGCYMVYVEYSHPSYADIFKPNLAGGELYDDYLYAVEELKKIED